MVSLYAIAFLCSHQETLLIKRACTGFADGFYSLVGGKVEQGETARHAIHREVKEEIDLDIPEEAFELVHTFHRKGTENELIVLVFKADVTGMHPVNKEPEKHDDLRFFNIRELPENIVPAHKQAIECVSNGITYSEHGFIE